MLPGTKNGIGKKDVKGDKERKFRMVTLEVGKEVHWCKENDENVKVDWEVKVAMK